MGGAAYELAGRVGGLDKLEIRLNSAQLELELGNIYKWEKYGFLTRLLGLE